jgi:hypothetical protein
MIVTIRKQSLSDIDSWLYLNMLLVVLDIQILYIK